MGANETTLIKQHLIDPVICIRCNTCEATCPVGAITHDDRNYVVDADKCNACMACISPCPTGSIDNWRTVLKAKAYTPAEQLTWDDLPAELSSEELESLSPQGISEEPIFKSNQPIAMEVSAQSATESIASGAPISYGATLPPWSAAHAYTNLYGPKAEQKTIQATVAGNVRVTEVGKAAGSDYDTHHIVLDFGSMPFPVLEGQSIGIVPPGVDERGKPHHARQYSIASPRNGERAGYNNASLTIKRVLEDHHGNAVRGVASNFMCDLKVGDKVEVIGPFGTSFLMPNHPKSHIVMICTGTGSAPMRAMTEWRRRLKDSGKFESGKLLLFFGARSQAELPYFGPLQQLPKDFIDINFAYSREAGQPKKYVQDAMRERAVDLAALLQDPNAYFYVCGLKAMEEGVVQALQYISEGAGLKWDNMGQQLKQQGRLHLETY
jgi:benzoyl-CoA 2,3-epoxidase subunit A